MLPWWQRCLAWKAFRVAILKHFFALSIVNAGNTVVFCHAVELGLRGTELPWELEARRYTVATLEEIRSIAAERLHVDSPSNEARVTEEMHGTV
jgi:2-methylaconitate cis-trans-isomerase PrpF